MWRKLSLLAILLLFTAVTWGAAAEPSVDLREFSNQACPTGSAKYAVDIANPGTAADTYTVEVNEEWSTVAPSSLEIAGGDTDTAYIWLQPPADMRPGTYSFTVDITSSETGETQTVSGTLQVLSCRAVTLSVDDPDQTVCRGDTATYNVQVRNTGEAEETYELAASAGSLSHTEVTLAPGESSTVELTAYSDQEASETITVSAESTTSYAADSTEVAFTAEQCRDMELFVSPSEEVICEDETGEFDITLQNTGNIEDTYSLTTNVDGASVPDVTLEPGASETFKVEIAESMEGIHTVVARATSQSFSQLTRSESADLVVENCYDVGITTLGNHSIRIDQQDRQLMAFELENTGTRGNSYDLSFTGPEWTDLRPTETGLAPGERAMVYLYAAPDFFAEEGTYETTLRVTDASGLVDRVIDLTITVGDEEIVAETNGEDEVDPGITGRLISQASGLGIIILVLAALFVGGYWMFRRQWRIDEVQEPRDDDDNGSSMGPAHMVGDLTGSEDRDRVQSAEDAARRHMESERDRDYYKSANDFLAQNRNTVRKALREDDFSKRFLEVLLEEEQQDKNRTSVLNEIERQLEKKNQ